MKTDFQSDNARGAVILTRQEQIPVWVLAFQAPSHRGSSAPKPSLPPGAGPDRQNSRGRGERVIKTEGGFPPRKIFFHGMLELTQDHKGPVGKHQQAGYIDVQGHSKEKNDVQENKGIRQKMR